MESKKREIARKEQSLQARIRNLEVKESEFAARLSKLEARERRVKNLEKEVAGKEQSVEARIKNFEAREDEFKVRLRKLEDRERRAKSLEIEVARKEQSVEARIKNVEARKSEFAVRSSKLEARERRVKSLEKEVARKEQSVEARIKNVEARKSEFAVRFGQLEDSEREFAVRSSKLEDNEREFAVRFSKLEDCEARFMSLENWNHDAMKGEALQSVLNERIDVLEKSGDVILAVIKVSSDPAKLVLDAMEGFYPLPKNGGKEFELGAVRRSCVLLLEQLLRASPPIRPNVRDDAKRVASEWKGKMSVEELEVLGLLLLVGVYGLVPEFDKDEFVTLFCVVAEHRLASEICRVIGITDSVAASEFDRIAWTPPLEDFVKVNFDGSFIRRDQLGGLGVVVRDKNGKVIAARARKTLGVLKSNVVELLAAKEALDFVSSLGFKKIVVEGDCLSAINLLLGKTTPKIDENAIALDAICLASGFTSCLFTHVKREGNKVADGLSKFATKVDSVEEWKEDLPSWLSISSELDIQGIAENRATTQFDFPGNVNDQQYHCPGTQSSMSDFPGNVDDQQYQCPRTQASMSDFSGNVDDQQYQSPRTQASTSDFLGNVDDQQYQCHGTQASMSDFLGNVDDQQYQCHATQASTSDFPGNVDDQQYLCHETQTSMSDFPGNVDDQQYQCPETQASMSDFPANVDDQQYQSLGTQASMSDFPRNVDDQQYQSLGTQASMSDFPSNVDDQQYQCPGTQASISDFPSNVDDRQYQCPETQASMSDFPSNVDDQQYQCIRTQASISDFPDVNGQQYQSPGTQASMDHEASSNLFVPYCLQDAATAPGYYNTPTSGSVYGLSPQKSVDTHCFNLVEWIKSLVLFCLYVFLFLVLVELSPKVVTSYQT